MQAQQISIQEKRYLQIEYLVENGLRNVVVNNVLNLYMKTDDLSLQLPLQILGNIFECGEYFKIQNGCQENKYCLMFGYLDGVNIV